MKNYRQRLGTLEQQLGATVLFSTFIMAADREDADRQVQQFEALHPDCGLTLFVMIGPTVGAAR